jgi:hypothetical protein
MPITNMRHAAQRMKPPSFIHPHRCEENAVLNFQNETGPERMFFRPDERATPLTHGSVAWRRKVVKTERRRPCVARDAGDVV